MNLQAQDVATPTRLLSFRQTMTTGAMIDVSTREPHRVISLRERLAGYVGYGWAVLPLIARGKEPDTKLLRSFYADPRTAHLRAGPARLEEVEEWFRLKPTLNLGVFPSECLALIDIDRLDLVDPDIPTPTASSGREGGGKHIYLSSDRVLPTRRMEWGHLNPAYLVLPGSTHPTGRLYEWLPGRSPDQVPFMDYREAMPLLGLEGE
jgi:hypothetical protein